MAKEINQIQHHQRILITGPRAYEILALCKKVLDAHTKPYDILTDQEQSISNDPIVLIVSANFKDYNPHIVLIDAVIDAHKDQLNALAVGLPRSGTLIYNSTDTRAKEIGEKELEDVHKEEYKGEDVHAAAKKLVQQIGISEDMFDSAI